MEKVDFIKDMEKGMEYLHTQGAFLTVKSGDVVNTMTISWGNIGYEWKRPIFTVLVRKSRYTHELIESSDNFTVSIPLSTEMKNALSICGTKSGRDINKYEECNLTLEKSQKVETPIIGECELHYECKIVYKHEMNVDGLSKEIRDSVYSDDDMHTLYYGEIVDCYNK